MSSDCFSHFFDLHSSAGGLGSYYLLLEHCDFLETTASTSHSTNKICSANKATTPNKSRQSRTTVGPIHAFAYSSKRDQAPSPLTTSPTSSPSSDDKVSKTQQAPPPLTPSNSYSAIKCKRLIQQALEASQQAMEKFATQSTHNRKHHKLTPSSLSIFENDWMGAHALHAVCLMRLERLEQKIQEENQQSTKKRKGLSFHKSLQSPSKVPPPPPPPRRSSSLTTPTKSFLYKTNNINSPSLSYKNNPQPAASAIPPYQPILDQIHSRLQLVHNPELARNVFYNYDVVVGRAGALQLIWWIRKELNRNQCCGCGGDQSYSSWAQDIVVAIVTDMIEQGLATAEQLRQQEEEAQPPPPKEVLFWVCDSHGTHKYYLHASRGVVGILHTLLGLSKEDWKLVEEKIPKARQYLRKSIDMFVTRDNDDDVEPEQNENDSIESNIGDKANATDSGMKTKAFNVTRRHSVVKSYRNQENCQQLKAFQKRILFANGNLRPFLDAPEDQNLAVDWFQGASGLSMLLLEASQVFECKDYLLAAHGLCDCTIFPKAIERQAKSMTNQDMETNSRLAWRSNTSHHRRTLYNLSSPVNEEGKTVRRHLGQTNEGKGPAGMASVALTLFMLSESCRDTLLQSLWKNRAVHIVQLAHQEWMHHLETVPLATGGWNPYSIYEGMGSLLSLLWQLSSTTQSHGITTRLPFYSVANGHNESKITISGSEIKMLLPKRNETPPISPPIIRRTLESTESPQSCVRNVPVVPMLSKDELAEIEHRKKIAEQKLFESRKRRAKAEQEAMRRKTMEEAMRQQKIEDDRQRKLAEEKRRKAQLEARKHLQVNSRKMAMIRIQEESKRNDEERAKKKAAEEVKREAMLLARKQAQERVQSQRRAKAEKEELRAKELEQKRLAEVAAKQTKVEAEFTKRKEMAEQLRKAKRIELELAKEKEQQRLAKEREAANRKQAEIQKREEQRKKRDEERRRRMAKVSAQQDASKKRKEEEIIKLRIQQEEQRRQRERQELQAAEEERKRRNELLRKKAAVEKQRAREKAKKERELEELRFKMQLEKMLKKEEDRQKLREKQRKRQEAHAKRLLEGMLKKEQAEKERLKKSAGARHAKAEEKKELKEETVGKILPKEIVRDQNTDPEQQQHLAVPSRFTLPTRQSLFWSLQSDSKIGTSDDYNIALVNDGKALTMQPNNQNSSFSPSSEHGTKTEVDSSCNKKLSSSVPAQSAVPMSTIPLVEAIPRRRKGVDPSRRIHSLSQIVQGTLELKKQL